MPLRLVKNVPTAAGYYQSYDCALQSLLSAFGDEYPRWYLSSVAGFHHTFEYLRVSPPGDRAFITLNFTRFVYQEIEFALKALGYAYTHIHNEAWDRTWDFIEGEVGEGRPLLAGPLDFYYLSYIDPQIRSPQPHLSDHYVVLVGFDEDNVYLNDTFGFHYVALSREEFRLAMESTILYYTFDNSSENYKRSLLAVTGRRGKPDESEVAINALDRLREKFMEDRSISSVRNDRCYYSGVLGLKKLADELAGYALAENREWALEVISYLYNYKVLWGNQCRAELAVFLGHCAKLLPSRAEVLEGISGSLRESAMLWAELYRALREVRESYNAESAWRSKCLRASEVAKDIASRELEARNRMREGLANLTP
ncbi:MAG: hypothetical protein ACUVXI_16480 [bacterium]